MMMQNFRGNCQSLNIHNLSIRTVIAQYRPTFPTLMAAKLKSGKILGSEAIISDAHCTKTCLYLSVILLASSSLYELFRVPYIDLVGSLAIAWFAFSEGREAFEKVRNNKLGCGCGDCH